LPLWQCDIPIIWLAKRKEKNQKASSEAQSFFGVFNQSIYQLVNDLESVAYATTSVLQAFLDDGVRYLELRTIPRASPNAAFTRDQYLSTVLDTIAEFKSQNSSKISVYLILGMDRGQLVTDSKHAHEIVDLAIANRARGVIGVDVCGNPTKGDISLCRDAFARAKKHGLGLTVHFAEVHSMGLHEELQTMLSFNPDRLGHVIHVPDDIKQEIARRRLGLELCISCNVHAKMFDGGFLDHHFGYWRHEECPVILCTDDVGFFCSPVSNEYLLAAEHFQLERRNLISISRKAVKAIFGGDEEKQRLWNALDEFESNGQ
jgi:adenosine deaminase